MNPFEGMTPEQITEATGIIPVDAVVAKLNGNTRKFEGDAGLEVLRDFDSLVEEIIPGSSLFKLTLVDVDGDVLAFTFSVPREPLAKRLA